MSKSSIKAALLQVHSIIGLAISLLLTVIALTGVTMSFEDEIQASLNVEMTHVEALSGPMLAPDELIARLQAGHDYGKVSAITLTSDRSAAVRIRFARSEGGSRPSSVYVDPYNGHLLGAPRGEDFFATVRRLHRWLLLPGDANGYGRQITGVVAIGLIVLLISGIVLRWPRRAGSMKMWLKPSLALRGRGFQRSLHSVAGTWVLVIYLVMALTGLWYSFDWYRNGATWLLSRPLTAAGPMQPKSPRGVGAADAGPLLLDRVWSTFLRLQGDRFATAQLTLPAGTGTLVRIRSWARDASHDGARDEFRIDAVTGQLTSSEIYADKSTGERILASVLDIHRGSIFGWPGKLLFMSAAALMPLFMVTGFMLYLSRRKHRRASRPALGILVPGE
ncbi:PepSY-associated TM helix domain-containing protein [Bradyrhizobium sp. S69]|uniref:PepSY-associated TM helix domain-containing protein n=1 Tax=Bradyrhizobium sp. S69 TaxID=1641856 RepID=UPI00131D459E|nr:PepSY-associated TM helix domain-containing protein [Bradyrhizobium sp. S69]